MNVSEIGSANDVSGSPLTPVRATTRIGDTRSTPRRRWPHADRAFAWGTRVAASGVIAIPLAIAYVLTEASALSRAKFGWTFLWTSAWDPVALSFGALPFVYGTLATSVIAITIALPLGLLAAICLAELLPTRFSDPLAFLIELLVAVPSVVYGLLGVFILVPIVRSFGNAILPVTGSFPLLAGPMYGIGLLTAGVLLAVMIVPFIVSVSREVLLAVPQTQRDAALALGATRWETVWRVVVPYALIGNRPEIAASLFAPAHTMAAVLANEFAEADTPTYLSALMQVALVLFGITMLVNAVARLLIAATTTRAAEVRG